MPFGEYENFKDCVAKNQDQENPDAYCAAVYYAITGEWPSEEAATKGTVVAGIQAALKALPENADVNLADVEKVIDWITGESGEEIKDFESCFDALAEREDITNPEALCALIHLLRVGAWPGVEPEGEEEGETPPPPDDESAIKEAVSAPLAVKSEAARVVVGPVLVPGEADSDGEVFDAAKIEKVAYEFMENYGFIDFEHTLEEVGRPVSSDILRHPETFTDAAGVKTKLPIGTWILGVRVTNDNIWAGVKSGKYRGFSVMGVNRKKLEEAIAATKGAEGQRLGYKVDEKTGSLRKILLSELGDDWIGVAVSILEKPSVSKSKFMAIKAKDNSILSRLRRRLNIKTAIKNNDNQKEVENMTEEEIKKLVSEAVSEVLSEYDIKKKEAAPEEPETSEAAPPEGEPEEPTPPDAEAEVAELKEEVAALKGKLEEREKDFDKLSKFADSAVKSQGLPIGGTGKKSDDGGLKRDIFGRRVK